MTSDTVLPSAEDCRKALAEADIAKASDAARLRSREEAEREALLDRFRKPSGVDDDERIRHAAAIVGRAVASGLTEIQVFTFPNQLCTDHGRAINNQEAGWEGTLTGLPKELYDFWARRMRPQGYKLKVQVVAFPGGMPGDIGMILSWG